MIEYQSITVVDVEGNRISPVKKTGANGVRVTVKSYDEADALYVDAACEKGFCGEEGIILSFAEPACLGYVAIESHSPFWCRPTFGKQCATLGQRIQMLLLQLDKETYRCVMPVCDDTYKTLLRGCEGGYEAVVFSSFEGLDSCDKQLALISADGDDPYAVIHDCAALAVKLLKTGISLREDKKMPEVLKYLGWCSWDAFQYHISHDGLLEKAKEFKNKKVPVHFAILDDMWGDVPKLKTIPKEHTFREMVDIMHHSRLHAFEGDPERFPKGMGAAISDLKKAGIPEVGLWYPTTGYWKGFAHDNKLLEEYPDDFITAKGGKWHDDNQNIKLIKPETESAMKMYDVLASRAKEWGIDFIKVDNQGFHKHFQNLYPIGKSARVLQAAIDASAQKHFNGALINCMGMPSECMFNRPSSAVSRCSDDFMPESREWFSKNILQCAYNGLLQGQFYINDWDMWWTDDEQASKNSLCRAISGGPVYVSDKLGRTRPEVLLPLILSNGRVLQPDGSAMPTQDCLINDPTKSGAPFKIFNRVGKAGLVAAFNIDAEGRAVSGSVSAEDAQLLSREYVCYEYFTGECFPLKAGESFPVDLKDQDTFRLYLFVPMQKNAVTVMGRTDKFIGIKAVESVDRESVALTEGGRLGFYTQQRVRVFSNVRELIVKYKRGLSYVDLHPDETTVYFRYSN